MDDFLKLSLGDLELPSLNQNEMIPELAMEKFRIVKVQIAVQWLVGPPENSRSVYNVGYKRLYDFILKMREDDPYYATIDGVGVEVLSPEESRQEGSGNV